MNKPALTSKSDLPGAVSRFEDYLGTHILQTPDVHFVVGRRSGIGSLSWAAGD